MNRQAQVWLVRGGLVLAVSVWFHWMIGVNLVAGWAVVGGLCITAVLLGFALTGEWPWEI